ncbi:poly(A) RNA polymerase GLD2-like [Uloborus diversus]|uniref:poly(A) RNA polymerase GLD2-like n=1 Tax=Uloborus diversus TaxID=327109 RepID=UPI002409B9FD|nr:poly(A) RNA polymerase GLD2-like [Uloborus diversus]
MFQSSYPASWFISSQLPKTPFLFTYSDFSLLSVDHLTAFMPLPQHHPLFGTSQLAFDVPHMKRIPVNSLMQNVDTMNSYLPFFRRRNVNQSSLDRQCSKESLTESLQTDSGVSSSRSSTPSSVETSESNDVKSRISPPGTTAANMNGFRKNTDRGKCFHGQNFRQFQHNQKQTSNTRNSSIPKRYLKSAKDEWFKCSVDIWEHYLKTKQKDDMYFKKMALRSAVHSLLCQIFPHCGLRVVGSSVNGLGTNNSDVDMCLVLSPAEIDQQTEATNLLKYAQKLLLRCPFIKTTDLIAAKVPILKFTDIHHNIQVDLNINNTVGIANTQLLTAYGKVDWRVPPLVLVIKKWAQDCQINNAKEMTLSSYSLVLMVIHYLQCGCEPAVLPCLQRMQPQRYEPADCWKSLIPYGEQINFHSKNTQSLGSLLNGFFDYYTNKFDFSRDVISVRLGCKLPKQVAMNYRSTKNKRGHWKFICIEEPFNRTNTACAVYDQDSFSRITSAFRSTWLQLNLRKELCSILIS